MYSSVYFSKKSSTIHTWEYNEDGKKVYKKDKAPFYFYIDTKEKTGYKSIFGQNVKKIEFESYTSMRDARDMYKMANKLLFESDVEIENRYILDKWSGKEFEKPNFEIQFLDIEVHSEEGFPNPENADHPITIITVYSKKYKRFFIFAQKDFDRNYVDDDGNKVLGDKDWIGIYENEEELLEKFIAFVKKTEPDIITGWNSNVFDIPYIINRGYKILGPKKTNALSPIGIISRKNIKMKFGKEREVYNIAGINLIDYLDLYKKYNPKEQPTFKLDYIAKVELGDTKLAYEGSLKKLYNENWQRYVEYNIQDVKLLVKIDDKKQYIEMMREICYDCKILFEQFEKTTKVLDGAFISRLILDKIITPDAVIPDITDYEGAFVKPPIVGCHDWIMSYDATSLYPSIMMQHNISPETKVAKVSKKSTSIIKKILGGLDDIEEWEKETEATEDGLSCKDISEQIKKNGLSIASNGAIYRHDIEGIIAKFVKLWFDKRQYHKKKQFECHDKKDEDGEKYHKLRQGTQKILINSVYGYLGSKFSRFYDKDNALAVTITGQEVIQTAMNSSNEFFKNKWKSTKVGKKLNAKNFDNVVVYGDTDSLYLHVGKILESFNYPHINDIEKTSKFLDEKISPIINKVINLAEKDLALKQMNCPECKIIFKREMVAKRAIFLAKKRYVAWVIIGEDGKIESGSDHEIEVKGLESVRSSTPDVVRDKFIDFYKTLIQTKDRKVVNKFVRDTYNNLIKMESSKIAKISTANKLEEYTDPVTKGHIKQTPYHIKGSIWFNKILKELQIENEYENIYEGDKVKCIDIKSINAYPLYKESVISFKDRIPEEFKVHVDPESTIQKVFIKPLVQFYDVMKWQLPSFENEDIEDFFA